MFSIRGQVFTKTFDDRESAMSYLDSIYIDGMEATRDAIDENEVEYWSPDLDDFVLIKHTQNEQN